MKKLLTYSLLLTLALTLGACSNVQNFYFTYINSPEKLNYNNQLKLSDSAAILSDNLILISEELAKFEHSFEDLEQPPIEEDLLSLFNTYPWLSGVVLLSANGSIAAAMPQYYPMLPFDSFLELPKKADERAIRAYAADNYIIIGQPVFDNVNNLLGLTLIYFDFRNLVNYFPTFDKNIFVYAANDNILLSGHSYSNLALQEIDWKKLVKSKSTGIVKDKTTSYEWISRYIYNYPLVFVIEK